MLRAAAESADTRLQEAARSTIQAVEPAKDEPAAERAHRETLDQIHRFLSERKR